jgi:hypothetical protein
MIVNTVCSPVDLKINQDWLEVVAVSQNLIKLSKTHNSAVRRPVKDGKPDNNIFYDIGDLGSVSDHQPSKSWHMVHSPYLAKYLNWLPNMLEDMRELDPTWGISIAVDDLGEHTDKDLYPCALNYPIDTTSAETYIRYQNQEYTYPSLADQPWILDTQHPHGVRNQGLRVVFNLHFSADYTTVKNWFNSRPGLVYG